MAMNDIQNLCGYVVGWRAGHQPGSDPELAQIDSPRLKKMPQVELPTILYADADSARQSPGFDPRVNFVCTVRLVYEGYVLKVGLDDTGKIKI